MKRIAPIIALLIATLACSLPLDGQGGSPGATESVLPEISESPLIAYYPLQNDLNDATGINPPMIVQNAPLQPGGGLFSNGLNINGHANGSEISTPDLAGMDLAAFTISIQFNVPDAWTRSNPVFTGGGQWRWLVYMLNPDGSINLIYNNSQSVDCTVTYQLDTWHEAIITYDGQTAMLYLDKVVGCQVTTPLENEGDTRILQTYYADASTFYGTIRELRVYNAAVPVEEIPFP